MEKALASLKCWISVEPFPSLPRDLFLGLARLLRLSQTPVPRRVGVERSSDFGCPTTRAEGRDGCRGRGGRARWRLTIGRRDYRSRESTRRARTALFDAPNPAISSGSLPAANRAASAVTGGLVGGAAGGVIGAAAPYVRGTINRLRATPTQRAQDSSLRHLDSDGRTPARARQEYVDRQAQQGAKPETLSDLYPGSNVAGSYDAALNRNAVGREAATREMTDRAASAPTRILQDFDEALRRPPEYDALVRGAYRTRAVDAAPLYREARAFGAVDDRDINDQLMRLDPSIFQDATTWARRSGTTPAPLVSFSADGSATLNRTPTVTDLDHIKRALDNVVERGTVNGRLDSNAACASQEARTLLSRLDQIVPRYAEARAAYADPSGLIDAANLGRDVFRANMRPEQL